MKFWQRLRVYLIGVGIGVVLSIIIFGGRGCDWTPTNRVKKRVFSGEIYTSDSLYCQMECQERDSAAVYDFINEADVDFSLSETQSTPKVYHLSHEGEVMKIALYDTTSTIQSWELAGQPCDCNGKGQNEVRVMLPVLE